jgi:hypothetical protein
VKKEMANPYRAVRQLERQLFRSVPERPEPLWQRDGNNAVPDRLTGRSLVADRLSLVSMQGAQLIATTIYRPYSKKVFLKPEDARALRVGGSVNESRGPRGPKPRITDLCTPNKSDA